MKRFVCFLGVALALIPVSIHAGWTRTYGGEADDKGYCVQQTSDGGYIVSGYRGDGGSGMWLLRIGEEGDTLWTTGLPIYPDVERLGGWLFSVQQTSDGGYITTGALAMTPDGKYHLCLFKTDASGDTLWSRFDWDWFSEPDSTGGVGRSVRQTSDGGYIITGYRSHWYEYVDDLWLIKTDSLGDTLWTRTYGTEAEDCGHCVRQTSDGGYIVAGYTMSSPRSLWLLKTDENGDTVWTSGLPEDWSGKGYSVCGTSDGGYIITGYVAPFRDGKYHLIVVKTNQDGDTIWTRMDPGAGGVGHCIQETSDGNYILTGYTSEWIPEINDLFLIKMDSLGDTLWTRIYGGADEDAGYSVDQTSDGGYIVAGATKSFGVGAYDLWLIKTDSFGDTLTCVQESFVGLPSNWHIVLSVGSEITLRYEDFSHGFHASVFDAAGRKVDELKSRAQHGVLTWGEKHSPGVYFFRAVEDKREIVKKAVLIR